MGKLSLEWEICGRLPASSLGPVPGSLQSLPELGAAPAEGLGPAFLGAWPWAWAAVPSHRESNANSHIASALGGKAQMPKCLPHQRGTLLQGWAPECELCLPCLLVTVTKRPKETGAQRGFFGQDVTSWSIQTNPGSNTSKLSCID